MIFNTPKIVFVLKRQSRPPEKNWLGKNLNQGQNFALSSALHRFAAAPKVFMTFCRCWACEVSVVLDRALFQSLKRLAQFVLANQNKRDGLPRIRCKTKLNRELASTTFPAPFRSRVFFFEVWLVHCTICVYLDCFSNNCCISLNKVVIAKPFSLENWQNVWYPFIPQELVRDLEQCFLCLYGHPSISKKAKVCELLLLCF